MRTRFHPPAHITKTRFFTSEAKLRHALEKMEPWVLLDRGVSPPFSFEGRGFFSTAGGENGKRWAELEKVLQWLAQNRAERSQPLLVVGGGAVLDLGALAASLYMRGIPLILVPTTLLGMVDATLGGKSAVDMECKGRLLKNFAGTFYPAHEIWIFPDFLSTLPLRERISGAGEIFKTLWIKGEKWEREPLLKFVHKGNPSGALLKLARACLAFKGRVVERDPLDQMRIREVLNFGHTVGHALESASGLSHGECVLWGMAIESSLLGSKRMMKETYSAIFEMGLALPEALTKIADWEKYLAADKKIRGGKIELSLLSAPGKIVKKTYSSKQIAGAIRVFPKSFRRA